MRSHLPKEQISRPSGPQAPLATANLRPDLVAFGLMLFTNAGFAAPSFPFSIGPKATHEKVDVNLVLFRLPRSLS